MPAADTFQQRRGGQLPTGLLWTGVGLAPVAAALVLLGGGAGVLRVAAVLAILAVVLIGLSITLRPDASGIRAELEDALLDELDAVREEVRQDMSQAARASHRALTEKVEQLSQMVDTLRGQVETLRAGTAALARREPEQVRPANVMPANPMSQPVGMSPPVGMSQPAGMPASGMSQPAAPNRMNGGGNPMGAGGIFRHTETVQVTTRHTVVDQHDADRSAAYRANGNVYGPARAPEPAYGVARPEPARRPLGEAPRSDSWTEERLRDRLTDTSGDIRGNARGRHGYDSRHYEPEPERRADHRSGEYRRPRPYDRDYERDGRVYRRDDRRDDRRDEPETGNGWTGMHAGDRWAEVREDDRGRELRMGERRAAVHRDETGTAMRIEDRWAEVRAQDSPGGRRRANGEPETRGERRAREGWRDEPAYRGDSGNWAGPSWDDTGAPVVGRAGVPALPPPDPTPASNWAGTGGWRVVPDDREGRRMADDRVPRRIPPDDPEPRRRRPEDPREERWDTGSVPRVRDTGSMPRVRDTGSMPRVRDTGSMPRVRDTGSIPRVRGDYDPEDRWR